MECFLISLLGLLLSVFVKDRCLVKKFLLGLEGEATGELSSEASREPLEQALDASPRGDTEPGLQAFTCRSLGLQVWPSAAGNTSSGNGSPISSLPSREPGRARVTSSSLRVSLGFVFAPSGHFWEEGTLGSEYLRSGSPRELFRPAAAPTTGSRWDVQAQGPPGSPATTVPAGTWGSLLGKPAALGDSASGSLLS